MTKSWFSASLDTANVPALPSDLALAHADDAQADDRLADAVETSLRKNPLLLAHVVL